MRAELMARCNVDSVDDLTIQDVEDYLEVREVVNAQINELYALHPSSYMSEEEHWTKFADVDFSEGA
jgi:hypothetical protein